MAATTLRIVLRKEFYLKFLDGEKRVEYRRVGKIFNAASCQVGRPVRLSYRYDNEAPCLHGRIVSYRETPAFDMAEPMTDVYPDLTKDDKIAAIGIEVFDVFSSAR